MTGDIHALAGAYVLNAVDDVERAAFTRHLAQCESCATEVQELRETAARLTDATWSVPPPRMRAEVLDRVSRVRQLSLGAGARRGAGAALSRWRRGAAAAAVVGIFATGAAAATYGVQHQRVREQQAIAEAAQTQTARMRAVLSAPDVRLRATALRTGGRVTVAFSASEDRAVVALTAPPAGPGRVYQLWMMDGTTPHSADVLATGEHDATRLVNGVRGMETFGITVEPEGGSPTPTLATVTTLSLV